VFLARVGIISISVSGHIDAKMRAGIYGYKEASIISKAGAAIWSKSNFELKYRNVSIIETGAPEQLNSFFPLTFTRT
jgi:hypothetical protein